MARKQRELENGRAARADADGSRNGEANGNGEPLPAERSDRMELPLAVLPSHHPCHSCGDCCRYVAVEIDAPTCNGDYEHIFWYLTHRNVAIYVDWEGDWFIEFQTTCENETESITCAIYEERPRICSEFSWEDCERNVPEPAAKRRFEAPKEFFDWLEAKRPKAFERYMKFRRKLLSGRRNAAGRVRVRTHPVLAG